MPFILPANTLSAGGYDVANSCIFDRASTDSMSKSMSDGSSIKGTFSAWIKVDGTGNEMNILSHFQDTSNVFSIATSGSSVYVVDYNSGYSLQLATNRIMRDPSAWFHLYVAIDRSQATADNRNRIFINGVEETSFSNRTNYSQQTSGGHQDAISMNDGQCTMYLGGLGDGNQMFGGYLAELHWIDGTVPAVTEFGEFDEDSGIWKPKLVSGISYGTNGFYLDFQDASNLGNDANGGTDLTESNIASTNQSTDTCTNNHATFNPLGNYFPATVFSEGNLKGTFNSSNYSFNNSTIGVSAGRWYFETKIITTATDNQSLIGISDRDSVGTTDELGSGAYQYGFYGGTQGTPNPQGKIRTNDGYSDYSDVTYTDDDIIGTYVDLEDNKIYFSKNGTLLNSGTGFSITAPASTDTGFYFLSVGSYSGSNSPVYEVNFGSPSFALADTAIADDNGYGAFEYSPNITGDSTAKSFYTLNTKNLAEFG